MTVPIRAVTFDYWDTLYADGPTLERGVLGFAAIRTLLDTFGRSIPDDEFTALCLAADAERKHASTRTSGRGALAA